MISQYDSIGGDRNSFEGIKNSQSSGGLHAELR
jgi:hypothetical protein